METSVSSQEEISSTNLIASTGAGVTFLLHSKMRRFSDAVTAVPPRSTLTSHLGGEIRYDEHTTSILTEWFLTHKRWPYPAAREKDELAAATKLSTLQM